MSTTVVSRQICTPVNYDTLKQFCLDTNLSATAINDNGESVVISTEPFEGSYCYRLDTCQHNGWIRTNYYYEDGSIDELFER